MHLFDMKLIYFDLFSKRENQIAPIPKAKCTKIAKIFQSTDAKLHSDKNQSNYNQNIPSNYIYINYFSKK